MNTIEQAEGAIPAALRLAAGVDRFGETRGLPNSRIDFKVCANSWRQDKIKS